MIDIRISSEGDAFLRGIMEDFADEIRESVSDVRCPVHPDARTLLSLVPSGDDEILIDLEACCERMEELIDDALAADDGSEDEGGEDRTSGFKRRKHSGS